MSKTKVVEVFEGTQMIMQIGTDTEDRVETVTVGVDELEELNSDYINEHYGDLQDVAYQKGLADAWEFFNHIYYNKHRILNEFMDCQTAGDVLRHYTAKECIEKFKGIGQKQDEIKVGDEVMAYGLRGVVTCVCGNLYTVMMYDGSCGNWGRNELKKTGKQHDIDKILEAMRT